MRSVDIIIPVYNSSLTVIDSLLSAYNQINVNVNLIVINDGSTDNTEELIKNWEYFKYITYIKKENGGVASARNMGLDLIKSEYICFLDSDDILFPDFCNELILKMESKNLNIAFSDYVFLSVDNKTKVIDLKKNPIYYGDVKLDILKGNFLMTPTVLFSSSIIEKNRFDQKLKYNEDWKFWINLLVYNEICFVNKELVGIRTMPNGLSSQKYLHKSSYYNVVLYVHNLINIIDLDSYSKDKIYYHHSYQLLSYGLFLESKIILKYIQSYSKISMSLFIKYCVKYLAIKSNIIFIFRKIKKYKSRNRLDLI